jgi:EmrB/QacA subfamily drug resistance transporter
MSSVSTSASEAPSVHAGQGLAAQLTRRRVVAITGGVMLGMFMGSMEATVVATAMPTIVAQLGGLETYSWVFTGFMLTSTTTVPLYGKFSDLFGRRRMFVTAMGIFLVGSLLCGLAQTMPQLIVFRLLQGIGAGGLLPLALIILGDLFSYQQRARMQGLFAGVWGVSSIVGPLLGGFLVDQISWHWVFLINLGPGLITALLVWFLLPPSTRPRATGVRVDYAGAALLTAGVAALLLGMVELGTALGWGLLALSAALLAALVWVERHATDPILPVRLFSDRLFAVACLHGLLAGWAMFGSLTYIPLFVQAVLGANATEAGRTLTPLLLAWVAASVISSRLLLIMRYRPLLIGGMVSLVIGTLLLSRVGLNTSQLSLMLALGLMGLGMGLSIPVFLIVVQSTVPRRDLGAATSALQFTRSMGGTIGVSVMGAALAIWLAANLAAAGLGADSISLNALLDPATATGTVADNQAVREALAAAIRGTFTLALGGAVLALGATIFAPSGNIAEASAAATAQIGD